MTMRTRDVYKRQTPVGALAGGLGGAGQRRAEHDRVGAEGQGLDEAAGVAHAAVGDDLHVAAAGFVLSLIHI